MRLFWGGGVPLFSGPQSDTSSRKSDFFSPSDDFLEEKRAQLLTPSDPPKAHAITPPYLRIQGPSVQGFLLFMAKEEFPLQTQ